MGSEPVNGRDRDPGTGAETPGAAARHSHPALEQLLAAGEAFHHWILRPRVRLTVTGAALLLIGGLMMANSVWTLPLVIVGVLMVAIAWIGPRLEGRFAVQWGENGTELAFRARIRPPEAIRPALARPSLGTSSPPDPAPAPRTAPDRGEVIDGQARTVEIEVAELEALIAAVEARGDARD